MNTKQSSAITIIAREFDEPHKVLTEYPKQLDKTPNRHISCRIKSPSSCEAVLGFSWPVRVGSSCPQSSVSLIIATKSQDENLFICLNREFQPRNQFTQLSLSPIAQLVLFLL